VRQRPVKAGEFDEVFLAGGVWRALAGGRGGVVVWWANACNGGAALVQFRLAIEVFFIGSRIVGAEMQS